MLSALITLIAPSMLSVYLLHGGDFVFVRWGLSHFHNPWVAYAIVAPAVFVVCVVLDLLRRGVLRALSRKHRLIPMLAVAGLFIVSASAVSIPEWLPEDFRFAVSSNEAEEVEETLALMRDALHPKLRAMMKGDDVGPTLQWIVHASQPGMTNWTVYFETFKPNYQLTFDRMTLTNRAARLSNLPPVVKLSLIYDDGTRTSISRPVPGVDYPGVAPEDAGSTSTHICIALCAPKNQRRFRIKAEVANPRLSEYEFKWMSLIGSAYMYWGESGANRTAISSQQEVRPRTSSVTIEHPLRIGVFARVKGGIWCLPSIIDFRPDEFGKRTYISSDLVDEIDYGTFKDVYRYGDKNVCVGFTRMVPGLVKGERYSNLGEHIISEYSDDSPKITHKVHYCVRDGQLVYVESDEETHRKNCLLEDRASKW